MLPFINFNSFFLDAWLLIKDWQVVLHKEGREEILPDGTGVWFALIQIWSLQFEKKRIPLLIQVKIWCKNCAIIKHLSFQSPWVNFLSVFWNFLRDGRIFPLLRIFPGYFQECSSPKVSLGHALSWEPLKKTWVTAARFLKKVVSLRKRLGELQAGHSFQLFSHLCPVW